MAPPESPSWIENLGTLLAVGAAAAGAWWSQWREGQKEEDHAVHGKQVVFERADLADLSTMERAARDIKEAAGRQEHILDRLLDLETSNREEWRGMHDEFRAYERNMQAYVERNRAIRDENHHLLEANHEMLKEVCGAVRKLVQEMEFAKRLRDELRRLGGKAPPDGEA